MTATDRALVVPQTAPDATLVTVSDARPPAIDRAAALRNAHHFFETTSGWAPPDEDTLAEWVADGVSPCPDECTATPDGWCDHGIASWALILADPDDIGR
ncbi:MAG: hypothetical protein JJU45_02750 [Acidimicrobiia bacterium]|nr:hypothetical protein [Acidimicrobiia bacterium]